ncbi:MAG: glycosyl transferase, partial [Acinetobacter bohemicus]
LLHAVQQHIDEPQAVEPVTMFSLKEMCDRTIDLYKHVLNLD